VTKTLVSSVLVGDVGEVPSELSRCGEHGHVVGGGDLPHLLHGAAGDHRVLVRLGYGQVVLADHVHLPHGAVPGLAERRLALQVWHVEGAHPGQALGQRVVLPRSTTDNWLEFLIHDTIQSADLHTSGGLSW